MTAFADSSALVKLYVDETGQELVRSLPALVVSQLARVEVPAAIWRKCRTGAVTAAEAGILVGEFEADYFGAGAELPRFDVVRVSTEVLETASRLSRVHDLRAYDAVQLASATEVAMAVPECRTFVAFDNRLCDAAVAEGFEVRPGR